MYRELEQGYAYLRPATWGASLAVPIGTPAVAALGVSGLVQGREPMELLAQMQDIAQRVWEQCQG